jgi:putative FmdB family regulatory protein
MGLSRDNGLDMPLYEYTCRSCTQSFELLVRGNDTLQCPSCTSTELERRSSVFAARTGGASGTARAAETPGGCGHCGDPRGPGSCSIN